MSVISGQGGERDDELKRLSIPSVYPAQLVLLAARFGVDTKQLLHGTGIDPALLERTDGKISPASSIALTRRALLLTNEPALGFYYGLQLKLSSHGAVGMLAMTSATLGDAISVLSRFAPLRTPNLHFVHYEEGDHVALELVDTLSEPELRAFVVEALVTALVQMARTLLGRPITGAVELDIMEPSYFARFAHLWPSPVRFEQRRNRVLLPKERLNDAVQMADSVAAKQIERECEQELSQRVQADSFLSDLRRLVVTFEQGFPSLEQVAEATHTSARTLKRKLAARGTTYRQLVDELKRERALILLANPSMDVREIGQALGYADPANFHRAFRRWLGVSPESFRKKRE